MGAHDILRRVFNEEGGVFSDPTLRRDEPDATHV
jgi:hypothetical protein